MTDTFFKARLFFRTKKLTNKWIRFS